MIALGTLSEEALKKKGNARRPIGEKKTIKKPALHVKAKGKGKNKDDDTDEE